jgi:hypothetical protein
MNIAIDIVENDDLLVENEFINALNENWWSYGLSLQYV